MPDTPVAAPAASAPVAPSPAPVSTPAPSSAPAPATTPTPSSTGSETTPVAVPGQTPAPTETPAAPPSERSREPQRSDFADSAEGIEKFLNAHNAWEDADPDAPEFTTGEEVPVDGEGETADPEPETAPEGEETPSDNEKPAEPEAPTPEGLSKLFEDNPELKEAIEANPTVKGALYAMARQNAKAQPILEIFPNVEAATFANERANEFVSLKTAFTLSDSPEKMKDAAGMFLEQFAVVDEKGTPVLDAQGNPTYGEDLPLFVAEMKNRDNAVRISDLKAKIEAGKFLSDDSKENAEQLLAAYEFIAAAEAAGPEELDKPDTSGMTPEAKAYFERKEAELNAEREKLGLKDKALTEKQRTETRTKFDTQYRQEFGGSSGKFMANYLKQKETDGVAIPRYMLTMRDPKTGVSVFAQQAFQRLNEKLDKLPQVKAHSAGLQINAVNEQGLAARVAYGQSLIDEHLSGIIDSLLEEAGVSLAADVSRKIADREQRRSDARTEPAAGAPASPRGRTDEQLIAQARANVDKKFAGKYIDEGKKMEEVLKEKFRLES